MIRRRPNIGKHPLVAYDWDERTGVAVLTYVTRDAQTRTPGPDLVTKRHEPTNPRHTKWRELGRRSNEPTGLLADIGERVEAQIEGVDDGFCWQYL